MTNNTNNTLKIFEHPGFGIIRTLEIDGEPWFVGKDAAAALGYSDTKSALADHVDQEDRQIIRKGQFATLEIPNRGLTIISREGLYSLIYTCKLSPAKPFKSWIQSDVLPMLREHNNTTKDDDIASKTFVSASDTNEKCAVQIFENSEFGTVRTLEEDGKVLFCGKDVASALGYVDTVNALKQHCRWVVKHNLWVQTGTKADGSAAVRQTKTSFIPESDVYRLITHSKLPAAEKFESWVFDEVLPTIRKHGMYAAEELLNNPDVMIKVLEALKEERAAKEALTEENRRLTQDKKLLEQKSSSQERKIALLKPKAKYYDTCLFCADLIPISVISKDFGWSAKQMNKFLCEQGVQYQQG